MMGSTAMSRSWVRSHALTRGSGADFVGSLEMLASTVVLIWRQDG